jgi:hypothetical protein
LGDSESFSKETGGLKNGVERSISARPGTGLGGDGQIYLRHAGSIASFTGHAMRSSQSRMPTFFCTLPYIGADLYPRGNGFWKTKIRQRTFAWLPDFYSCGG